MAPDDDAGVPRGKASVALALGSNLGNPLAHLRAGVRGLAKAGVILQAISSVWRSHPWGYANQPDYLNAVVVGLWCGTPEALLAAAHGVERAAGRSRTFPNAPRTLDVDLVFVDESFRAGRAPLLPHPRWAERAFVVGPLAEVAPDWRDPVRGVTVHEVWSSLAPARRAARIVAPPSALRSLKP